ncbi:AAA family ATPase [Halobacillus yeomjeoni]|uniref:McrB family protein n=1 Tax=Halobacillus yeomjeoni TaxID=311194 RepID=UPI001CD751C9|nr:AAA family ATPase [Halobacillus yeomjeoni]MCA0984294.1 AAA family ATPase [Halobacillus yeomjeoni]
MIFKFMYDYIKQQDSFYTLRNKTENKIIKNDENGLWVIREAPPQNNVYIKKEMIAKSFQILNFKGSSGSDEFLKLEHNCLLAALLANLPFVDQKQNDVYIKKFDTLALPGSPIHQILSLLDDLYEGKYEASEISKVFEIENIKSLKMRARQSLRILGYLDNQDKLIEESFNIESLKEKIINVPYVFMVYKVLDSMSMYTLDEKNKILLEIISLTVVSSTDGTTIKNSVAVSRKNTIIQWLKYAELIDEDWNVINMNSKVKFWWVNQGKTMKEEKEGGYLWAPKTNKNGSPLSHHTDLLKANPGDVVLAYSQQMIHSFCEVVEPAKTEPNPFSTDSWEKDGNLLKVNYHELIPRIAKSDIPLEWRQKEDGPFDVNGNVKQGYFYELSPSFIHDFTNKFNERLPLFIKETIDPPSVEPQVDHFDSDTKLVQHIHEYIQAEGLHYQEEEVKSLYLSLKTKPFVILSGISGTGKTKIVEKFAASLGATEENGRFTLIPVRPDWSDGSDLIGFEDIKGEFKPGPFTKVLMEAEQNLDKPYFILLDEMNLARVEYYFSDLLSVMESRKRIDGRTVTSEIPTPESYPNRVIIPENVYIIGTVNMDETTHPFSSKVLDRANTMEFNDVALDAFPNFYEVKDNPEAVVSNELLKPQFLSLKDAFNDHHEIIKSTTKLLMDVNEILSRNNSHFGYRIRDEICFFMIYNNESQLMEPNEAFDRQLLQKVLPKLNGSDIQAAEIIERLFEFCSGQSIQNGPRAIAEAHYPKSAQKLATMYHNQERNGFTSFWLG